MKENIKLILNIKDPTLLDLAKFSKDMTELMVWATLIHKSQRNKNELKCFGKKNITDKQNPFFISPNKLKNYIKSNKNLFEIVKIEKKCILIDLLNSEVTTTFIYLFDEIIKNNTDTISIISNKIDLNLSSELNINIDVSPDLIAISKDRCQKICDKYNKNRN